MSTGMAAPLRNHLILAVLGRTPPERSHHPDAVAGVVREEEGAVEFRGQVLLGGLKAIPEADEVPTGQGSSGVTFAACA